MSVCAMMNGAKPAPPAVEVAEDEAHHRVADERAEPLVQVVRAAQDRGEQDRLPRGPAELVQPAQQVADDQDLLEDAVMHGGQDQHGYPPPDRGQRLRDHGQAQPEMEGEQVEAQACPADHRGEHHAARGVPARLARVQADIRGPLPGPGQQVEHEHDRRERLGDARQLQGEVQPVVGGERPHDQRLLAAQGLPGEQRADQVQQGVQPARAERYGEDGEELPADHPIRRQA